MSESVHRNAREEKGREGGRKEVERDLERERRIRRERKEG